MSVLSIVPQLTHKRRCLVAKMRDPSEAKAEVAQKKVRGPDGKFLPSDPLQAAVKIKAIEEVQRLQAQLDETKQISEEDREYIGNDSRKFFEKALEKASTWYDGYKYAKELKPIQHPSLSSVEGTIKQQVTHKVLKWAWDDNIESLPPITVVEIDHVHSGDTDTIQAQPDTGGDTQGS